MIQVNVVVLAGKLSANAEAVELPSGAKTVRLRVQTEEDGRAFPLPVICEDDGPRGAALGLVRGDLVMVRGSLRRRFFRGTGGGRTIVEVVAREVQKLEVPDWSVTA